MATGNGNPSPEDTNQLRLERQRANQELQRLKLNKAPDTGRSSLQPGDTLGTRVSALEKQIRKLEVLTVVSSRLSQANGREQYITALQEICANLVGSEEIAVFEKTSVRDMQLVAAWDGCQDLPNIYPGQGTIGKAAAEGKTYFRDRGSAPVVAYERRLTACIPLKVSGNIVGVLAMFGLLPQKGSLSEQDHEVLEFLGNHNKNALLRDGAGAMHAR